MQVDNDTRICFLGESFVNGTGDRTQLGWTGRLCADLANRGCCVTHYNLGIRRETSLQLLDRWETEVSRRLSSHFDSRIVFCFGVNDTAWENGKPRVSQAESIANARQMLIAAKQKYPVLMISPLVVSDSEHNQRTNALSNQFAMVCADLEIPYFDAFTPLLQLQVWHQEVAAGDGAHPDAGGYAELAQLIQNWSGWSQWFEV